MYVDVTGQAVREHFQLFFVVRYTMALRAVRNFAMLLMTPDAVNLAVLARCSLPLAINIIMATAASLNFGISGETNP